MSYDDIDDFVPKNPRLYGISLFGWLLAAIFGKYDPDKLFYVGFMVLGAILSVRIYVDSRKEDSSFNPSAIIMYVFLWLGITTFSNSNIELGYQSYKLELYYIEFLCMLPLLIIWINHTSKDTFFGIQETEKERSVKGLWKIAVVILFVVKFLRWWSAMEFLILIPLITEAVWLQKLSHDRLPVLTLRIEQELSTKFAVPLSLLKSIGLILFAYMFSFLTSRFWVIILLGFMFAELIWMSYSVSTKFAGTTAEEEGMDKLEKLLSTIEVSEDPNLKDIKDSIDKAKTKIAKRKKRVSKDHKTLKSQMILRKKLIKPTIIIPKEKSFEDTAIASHPSGMINTSSKAHTLGKKIRSELQKPQYNLNHILTTLTAEDFSNGYIVEKDHLSFQSLKGEWKPPKNLLLFPIELGKYDFRRDDEILLLGFNKPSSGKKGPIIMMNFGSKGKNRKYVLSKESIQIGDLNFNMQTLIVSKEQWENASKSLTLVRDDNQTIDISYTGFETIQDLQGNLVKIGDKWIEIRKQAEQAIVDFLSGLLGTGDAVFMDMNLLKGAMEEETEDYDIID